MKCNNYKDFMLMNDNELNNLITLDLSNEVDLNSCNFGNIWMNTYNFWIRLSRCVKLQLLRINDTRIECFPLECYTRLLNLKELYLTNSISFLDNIILLDICNKKIKIANIDFNKSILIVYNEKIDLLDDDSYNHLINILIKNNSSKSIPLFKQIMEYYKIIKNINI